MILAFVIGSARALIFPLLEPWIAGSHAWIYTEAARAWLTGSDPWTIGPPAAIFAGPPPMLLPFVPFTLLPELAVRAIWMGGAAALAVYLIRRLRLPGYWLGFPPLFGTIVLGHPEMLVAALLIVASPLAGLAAVIKPYAALPLIAQRRPIPLLVAAAGVVLTVPLLPWPRFIAELPMITANLTRQGLGTDSTFGSPVLMALAIAGLAALGWRRALWLATPLLWPSAQSGYRLMCVPELSPILAITWSLPVPGATLAGLLIEAGLTLAARRWRLPAWLAAGITPIAQPVPGATGAPVAVQGSRAPVAVAEPA